MVKVLPESRKITRKYLSAVVEMAHMTEANGAKRLKLDDDSRNHLLQPQSQQNWKSTDKEDEGRRRKTEGSEQVNYKILKYTIVNPMYPITIEMMHTVSSLHGQVLRIVMLKEYGIEALVEFDNVEAAKRAKKSLYEAEIYMDCCAVKIDYVQLSKLKVYKNDSESWDYTNKNLDTSKKRKPVTFFNEPRYGTVPIRNPGNEIENLDPMLGQVIFANANAAVMMVYNLCMEKINAERLFNLFCQYGNIVSIKFLKSKEGCAMVEMEDAISVERAISNFGNTFMFGSLVRLGYSKQVKISDVGKFPRLPDGSPAFKNFTGNKNNRFLSPETTRKNKMHPPTNTLYFYNTAPYMRENEMRNVFTKANAPMPKVITVVRPKIGETSSSGLIEFETVTAAVEALSIINHYPIKSSDGRFAHIIRLRFYSDSCSSSTNRIEDK